LGSFNEVQILLSGLTLVYKLFQSVFGNEPSKEQLKILCSQASREALELFGDEACSDYMQSLKVFNAFCIQYENQPEATLEELQSEYTRLLLGPEKLPAYPWESVYVTKERLLFQKSTLEVRDCYRAFGFIPAEYPHVADDHIALELDFLGRLSEMAEKASNQNEKEEVIRFLEAQKDFMRRHLLNWVPDFARQMQQSKTNVFYPNAAILLSEFLKKANQAIDEILDSLTY
jgi:TorA maturation chaperone TorD